MEEIEYKLRKKNSVLVVNAISKLVENVRLKALEEAQFKETQELKLLKQKCSDAEPLVSMTACQGIVTLVEVGILPLASALSGFIATLTNAKNYTGIIDSIGHLLIIDLESHFVENKDYVCPFSVRSRQHPLITILKQRKDVWHDIYNQMHFLCSHRSDIVRSSSVDLLWPLFVYILCARTNLPVGCRQCTWELLVRQQQQSVAVLRLLTWLQVDSESAFESTVPLYLHIGELAIKEKDAVLSAALAPSMASIAHQMASSGHDPRLCFSVLAALLQLAPEASSCVLMVLSETVAICPAVYLHDTLNICKCIVESNACNALSVRMLEYAMLQWLLYPSYITGESVHLADQMISTISDMQGWASNSGKLLSNKLFGLMRPCDGRVGLAAQLCRLTELWQANPGSLAPWLERLAAALPALADRLLPFVSGVLLHWAHEDRIHTAALQLLLKMVQRQPELAAPLLTVILYRLASERSPNTQLELLHALTSMAVLKENVNLILHTLESMKNRPELGSTIMDLYMRVWKMERRCYPYLEKLLQETPKDVTQAWEYDIAKAAVIKEICETSPEVYSAELVAMLSKILNSSSNPSRSVGAALALEGLTALCKAAIVDITTTWKALAPKLNRDRRPLVVKSWCELMGVVPSLRCPTQDYERLVPEVISRLWSYVANSTDTEVITAAFRALSKFNLDQITLKALPEKYRQGLRLPSSYAKTPVDAARKPEDVLPYIPSECWAQMLLALPPEVLEAAGQMLAAWLAAEVAGFHFMPARSEPVSYSHLPAQCVCRGLVQLLQQLSAPEPCARQSLLVLGQAYTRPLPPLNWAFLRPLLTKPQLQGPCLALAARQAHASASARTLLTEFIQGLEPGVDTENEVSYLFASLGDLCRSIPPNILKPFVEDSLKGALDLALDEAVGMSKGGSGQSKSFVRELLGSVKAALRNEDIHDANRTMLSLIIEALLEKFDADNPLLEIYIDCVTELHTKYLERLSSPSVWWEVTADKLRLALAIRSAIAQRADTEVPLVWLNECIDATTGLPGEHTNVLKSIGSVMVACREHESNCPWTLQLMGQIHQIIATKNELDKEQIIVFLCDVFLITVIVLSGYDCINVSLDGISTSREVRLQLFPLALPNLLRQQKWTSVSSQVIEWLLYMQNSRAVSSLYNTTFNQGLVNLRHNVNFKESAWLRFLDSVPEQP